MSEEMKLKMLFNKLLSEIEIKLEAERVELEKAQTEVDETWDIFNPNRDYYTVMRQVISQAKRKMSLEKIERLEANRKHIAFMRDTAA